jgi:putative membrane protein
MRKLILRWAINAIALYAAIGTGWIDGIERQTTEWWGILVLALVFVVVNGLIKPIIKLLSLPLVLLTMGIFTLIINTGVFWLTGLIGQFFEVGFTVNGFMPAFLGGLLVSLVNWLLISILRDELK